MKFAFPLVVLLAGLAPSVGLGVLIGEPAPPLVVKEWIKGKPVGVKAGTNIYVVEIWNASSLASRAVITNLNEIQKRFRTNGVVVLGISDEPAEKIKEFVQHDGTNIDYEIAADDQRQTSVSYMMSVEQRGIPYTFVVGTNGSVLWHGHPLGGLDVALSQIIAGSYNLDQIKKAEIAGHQMGQYLNLARRGDVRARPAGRMLLAYRTNDMALLCDLAFQIATAPQVPKRDFALASQALDQAEKLASTNMARVMISRAVLLFESGKRDEGLARATQALASAQSPDDKTHVQSWLRTMEARMAAMKSNPSNTNQSNASETGGMPVLRNTNQSNTARTSDPVPAANTNQSKGPVGKP